MADTRPSLRPDTRPSLRLVTRPSLRLVTPAASAEEAAAVIAAIERFLRDHAPASAPPAVPSGWVRAALLEGVEREPRRGTW